MEDSNELMRLAQNCSRCAYLKVEIVDVGENASPYHYCILHEKEFANAEETRTLICGYFC